MSETKISCPNCDQHILLDDSWAGQTLPCPTCREPLVVPSLVPPVDPVRAGLHMNALAAPPEPKSNLDPGSPDGAPVREFPTAPTRTNGLAIASLVLSLLGCFGITAVAGVICGHLARRRIRADPSQSGAGIALAGMILGYAGLLFSIISLGVFVSRARQAGLELSAEIQRQMAKQSESLNQMGPPDEVVGNTGSGFGDKTVKLPLPADAVAGNIMGQKFTYTKAKIDRSMRMLSISDGDEFFADREVTIFLFLDPKESLENRTLKYSAKGNGMSPHLHISWKDSQSARKAGQKADSLPKTEILFSGYQLELKMGAIRSNAITGRITLKTTGKVKADLQGNFHAAIE